MNFSQNDSRDDDRIDIDHIPIILTKKELNQLTGAT